MSTRKKIVASKSLVASKKVVARRILVLLTLVEGMEEGGLLRIAL